MVKSRTKKFRWSRDLAYAVGLIVTDGNLSKDGRHISLRSSEPEQLKTFKKCLKLSNQITETFNNGFSSKSSYVVQFGNVQLHNWLKAIGVTPAKTYTIGAINIPKRVFQDFLRGHLDGDGCIQTYLDKYNKYKGKQYESLRIYTRFISASEEHIRWLYAKIQEYCDVKGALLYREFNRSNRVPMWEIKFAKYDSVKLFKFMYHRTHVPCLQRKRNIAEELLKKIGYNQPTQI